MKRNVFLLVAWLTSFVVQAQDNDCYAFRAQLDGCISVEIYYEVESERNVAGYIYYPKAKHPAPILLVGYWNDNSSDDEDNYIHLYMTEYQPDGTVSGEIYLLATNVEGDVNIVEGEWTNPNTHKKMKLSNFVYLGDYPDWFTESPFQPADPQMLGQEYSYSIWSDKYGDMMGGSVELRGAGRGRVHFHVCNTLPNIAEGASNTGRPAILDVDDRGLYFIYGPLSDCDYTFMARFYKQFVILSTVSRPEDNCFGWNASFDGVYIKTKQ